MSQPFIKVHNRVVRLDAIAYIDFLESGRSMIFVGGLTPEKQHISVDVEETRKLREYMDSHSASMNAEPPAGPAADRPRFEFRERRFA
jgi:hypothetical protein